MPLHNGSRVTERILMYGPFGSGKSHNWLRIARLAQKTKSDMKFHVIDTDNAVRFTIDTNKDFGGLLSDDGGNVVLYDAFDWESYVNSVEQITTDANQADFVIWDKLSDLWEWVQDYYTEQKYGKNQAQYFLDWHTQKSVPKGNEYSGDEDWKVIKKLYREYVQSRVLRGKFNVFATASAKPTDSGAKGRDPKEIAAIFSKVPLRPEGNKETGQMFHSIFMVQEKPKGYQIMTVRERAGSSREYYMGDDWTDKDFATSYLVQRAGWKLK